MRSTMRSGRDRAVRVAAIAVTMLVALAGYPGALGTTAWAQGAAQNPAPQRGTVKSVDGNVLTVATDSGPTVKISVPEGTKVQQLAPGSTDLKTATPSQLSDIAVGDRVLAGVRPGSEPDSYTARVVVLMKSSAIAQKNAAEQAEWRRNGVGGIVSSVDPDGTIRVAVGPRKVILTTTPATQFRRFANGSVQYGDAKPGSFAEIRPGDQIQARGTKSEDGSSVQATEVVSGSFKNLSGLIATIDAASGRLTLKDLATKKMYTVDVTQNSNLRRMPPQMAAMVAARTKGNGVGMRARAEGEGGMHAGGGRAGVPSASGGPGETGGQGTGIRSGDLSQMIARLPAVTLPELKPGDAVMIVASEPAPGSTTVSAVTLLSGVEPILTANPNGGVDLSGWNMSAGPTE